MMQTDRETMHFLIVLSCLPGTALIIKSFVHYYESGSGTRSVRRFHLRRVWISGFIIVWVTGLSYTFSAWLTRGDYRLSLGVGAVMMVGYFSYRLGHAILGYRRRVAERKAEEEERKRAIAREELIEPPLPLILTAHAA